MFYCSFCFSVEAEKPVVIDVDAVKVKEEKDEPEKKEEVSIHSIFAIVFLLSFTSYVYFKAEYIYVNFDLISRKNISKSKIHNNNFKQQTKAESPKPGAPLTMEIDPHLKQLQEQAKLFSRFNAAPGTEGETETPEKEPRKFPKIQTSPHQNTH